jgi:hypothetical protein
MIEIISVLPGERKNSRQFYDVKYIEHYKKFNFSGSKKEVLKKFNLDKLEFNLILRESLRAEIE